MTATAVTRPRHPEFDHVAALHRGPDDLAGQLLPQLRAAVAAGDAVLLCVPERTRAVLTGALDTANGVEFVSDDVRYARPGMAMRILHQFVHARLRDGAARVWSIGAIPFAGDTDRDADWLRYEAAVNDVLGDLPLRAVCTYDVDAVRPALVDGARCTHLAALDGGTRRELLSAADSWPHVPPVAPPSGAPLVRCEPRTASEARRALAGALGDSVSAADLDVLCLMVSELVTNGLLHGRGQVALAVWHDAAQGSTVLDVADGGDGIADPFFDLRPPGLRPGGAGLWIVGQCSERVSTHRTGGVHHVTASHRCEG